MGTKSGLTITPLNPVFAAEIAGPSLSDELDDDTFAEIRAALDEHSILVFRNQPMTDEAQVRFSQRFGPVERTISANPAGGTPFARQSNVDIRTGELIPLGDRRLDYQRGNTQWHADSTFKAVPSLCSILTAREVPPEGGDTEFASTRAAYEALSPARQAALQDVVVVHDLIHSRRRVGFEFNEAEASETPAVRHPLVQVNPVTGRKSLLIGAHASELVGFSWEESQTLLEELLALATQPAHCYRHSWSAGDLVIWDNRAALHRATPYDTSKYRRVMQRTTISNPAAAGVGQAI